MQMGLHVLWMILIIVCSLAQLTRAGEETYEGERDTSARKKVETIETIRSVGAEGAYDLILKTLDTSQSDAELYLKAAVYAYPKDQRLTFFQAVCLRSRWHKGEAARGFAKVMKMDQTSTEGRCASAAALVDSGSDIEKGMGELRDLVKEVPDDPLVLWMMGIECREYGRQTSSTKYAEDGAAAYKRMLTLFKVGPVLVHQTYANILTEDLHLDDDALKHRAIAVRLQPAGWTFEGYGNSLMQAKKYDEAAEAFRQASALDSSDPSYMTLWGSALRYAKKPEAAVEVLKKAVDLHPGNADAQNEWGMCLYELGRYAEAMRLFRWADRNGFAPATAMIGRLYEEGRGTETNNAAALECYKDAARRGNMWSMNRLGNIYSRGGFGETNPVEAIKWYKQAAALGSGEAFFGLGMMHYGGSGIPEDMEQVVKYYEQAIRAQEKPSGAAAGALATMYTSGLGVEKDMDKAVKYHILGVRLGNTGCMIFVGMAYEGGRYLPRDLHKALASYKGGIASHTATAQLLAARLLATSSDPTLWNGPEAVELATKARKQKSDLDWMATDTLAAAYARNGQFDEAAEMERKALARMDKLRLQGNPSMYEELVPWVHGMQQRLKLYESQQAYTFPAEPVAIGLQDPNPLLQF